MALRRTVLALPLVLSFLLTGCSGGEREGDAVSPEGAITGFSHDATKVESGLAAIEELSGTNADDLRAAALKHLDDVSPDVHFAAFYALSLTATKGDSIERLAGFLDSPETTERMYAAGSLLFLGDERAIPALVAALSDGGEIAFLDPPMQGWRYARSLLIHYTDQDLGLGKATTVEGATRVQVKWEAWWSRERASIHWDEHALRWESSSP